MIDSIDKCDDKLPTDDNNIKASQYEYSQEQEYTCFAMKSKVEHTYKIRSTVNGNCSNKLDILASHNSNDNSIAEEMDDNIICCICHESESYEDNPIVICDGDACGHASVHQLCYGIPYPLPPNEWYCDLCTKILQFKRLNSEGKYCSTSFSCALCPVRSLGLIMKQTQCGAWVHMQCFLWIPELQVLPVGQMPTSTISLGELSKLDKDRVSLICGICASSGSQQTPGIIQCSYKSCLTAFHVTCAMFAGHKMIVEETSSTFEVENDIHYLIYCQRHNHDSETWKSSIEKSRKLLINPSKMQAFQSNELMSPTSLLLTQYDDRLSTICKPRKRLKQPGLPVQTHKKAPIGLDKKRKKMLTDAMGKFLFLEEDANVKTQEEYETDEEKEFMDNDDYESSFINDDSSQEIEGIATKDPQGKVKRKRRKRRSLGDMRAVYMQSLMTQPSPEPEHNPSLRFAKKNARKNLFPKNGVVDSCLSEIQNVSSPNNLINCVVDLLEDSAESDVELTSEIEIDEINRSQQEQDQMDVNKSTSNTNNLQLQDEAATTSSLPNFHLLPEVLPKVQLKQFPPAKRPIYSLNTTELTLETADMPSLIKERIEKNRRDAIARREANRQKRLPPKGQIVNLDVEQETDNVIFEKSKSSATHSNISIIYSSDFSKSHYMRDFMRKFENAASDHSYSISFMEDKLLDSGASLLISTRVPVVWLWKSLSDHNSPVHKYQDACNHLGAIYKHVAIICNSLPFNSDVSFASTNLKKHNTLGKTNITWMESASLTDVVTKLLNIAIREKQSGFSIPGNSAFGVENVPDRVQPLPQFSTLYCFFRSHFPLLSVGSCISLSFRFEKFTIAKLPIAKLQVSHWKRMLPWISESEAVSIYSKIQSKVRISNSLVDW